MNKDMAFEILENLSFSKDSEIENLFENLKENKYDQLILDAIIKYFLTAKHHNIFYQISAPLLEHFHSSQNLQIFQVFSIF